MPNVSMPGVTIVAAWCWYEEERRRGENVYIYTRGAGAG